MGCRNDYLAQSGMEAGLQRAAKLAVFVAEKLPSINLPSEIAEQANEYYAKDVAQVEFLCETLRNMSEEDRDRIVYDGRNPVSRDLADWWDEHQKADKVRELAERAEADRKNALLKLTPREQKLLGLA